MQASKLTKLTTTNKLYNKLTNKQTNKQNANKQTTQTKNPSGSRPDTAAWRPQANKQKDANSKNKSTMRKVEINN